MTQLPMNKILTCCKDFVSTPANHIYREKFAGVYVKDEIIFASDVCNMIVWKTQGDNPAMFLPIAKESDYADILQMSKEQNWEMPTWERYIPNVRDSLAVVYITEEKGFRSLFNYWKDVFTLQGKLIKGESNIGITIGLNPLGLFSYAGNSDGRDLRATLLDKEVTEEEEGVELDIQPKYLVNICKTLAQLNPYELKIMFMKNGLYIETEEQLVRWYCCRVRTNDERN